MARGLKGIRTVRDFDYQNKVVFLRLDLNVPMSSQGEITDDNRIQASLPTVKFLLEKEAKVVMCSHLGRPKKAGDKAFSLEPVAKRMSELLKTDVLLVEEPSSEAVKALLMGMKRNQLILLENVRYEEGETKDSIELAQKWASYTDIYINDAFGASHRAHASIHALPSLIKDKGIGFLIEKEIQMLDSLLDNPKRPYVAVLGGAKVSDKIPVIEKLIDLVDVYVIGGAMAYTFLKAQGHSVGKSLVEEDKLRYAREIGERIKARNKTLLLPVDHVVVGSLDFKSTDSEPSEVTSSVNIPEGRMGVDIGPESLKLFSIAIREAGTVFWNGPMGVFEKSDFSKGTFGVAKAIAESKGVKVVGGGDSAAAAQASGYADQMTHISTGGGASLEYLQGDELPGLEILRSKHGRII